VHGRAADLPLVIARPSIVVGDSRSGWTPAFNPIYWPPRAFSRGLLDHVPADPRGVADIVPIDYVADSIVALHRLDHVRGAVALVSGDGAVNESQLVELACAAFKRPEPTLSPATATIIPEGEVHAPCSDVRIVFDDRRAREALHGRGIAAPRIGDYFSPATRRARIGEAAADLRECRAPRPRACRRGAAFTPHVGGMTTAKVAMSRARR
jgi:male sterility protein